MDRDLLVLFVLLLILFLVLLYYRSKKEYFQDALLDSITDKVSALYPMNTLQIEALDNCVLEDSYTEDKRSVNICVKDKSGRYYDENKLTQVVLHELAHAKSKVHDPEHTSKEFLDAYSDLMGKAGKRGMIDLRRL